VVMMMVRVVIAAAMVCVARGPDRLAMPGLIGHRERQSELASMRVHEAQAAAGAVKIGSKSPFMVRMTWTGGQAGLGAMQRCLLGVRAKSTANPAMPAINSAKSNSEFFNKIMIHPLDVADCLLEHVGESMP